MRNALDEWNGGIIIESAIYYKACKMAENRQEQKVLTTEKNEWLENFFQ